MEVQRVPRAELLHGNLRVSLYGPRSTEYQTDGTDGAGRSSQPRRYVGRCHDADGQRTGVLRCELGCEERSPEEQLHIDNRAR